MRSNWTIVTMIMLAISGTWFYTQHEFVAGAIMMSTAVIIAYLDGGRI